MFKLIKILNSGINVPEVVKLKASATKSYVAGEALVLSSGVAVSSGATTKPTFIAAANAPEGATDIAAYPISPDMIFECTVSAAPTSLACGSVVTLTLDADSRAVGVSATSENGVATVYDTLGAKTAGDKLLVRF